MDVLSICFSDLSKNGHLPGFRDHDRLQKLVQLMLDEVWQLTNPALVHLDHVQV